MAGLNAGAHLAPPGGAGFREQGRGDIVTRTRVGAHADFRRQASRLDCDLVPAENDTALRTLIEIVFYRHSRFIHCNTKY